jgi:diaminobutyrate-2-oxoglutarate transaminase
MNTIFERLESEVRSYCRRFPRVFARAQGCYLFDEAGQRYTDFFCAAGALNYGHNEPELKQALLDYLDGDGVVSALDCHTGAKRDFIDLFEKLILEPRGLHYKLQFTGPTGTSVVESAVKLARKATDRANVVAFTNGFHGMSGVSLSLTGNRYHRQRTMAGNVTRLPYDQYLGPQVDTLAYFRKLLEDESSGLDLPAAVIVETVQAEGGIRVASVPWLQKLRALTAEFGILLIVDEIQAGCGRAGRFFSFERAGIRPDVVCLSKSLSGFGIPFSLLLLDPRIDAWNPGEDSGTFRGNNLAFVTASAALKKYWRDGSMERRIAQLEETLAEHLRGFAIAHRRRVRDVRGAGLLQGMEFFSPQDAALVASDCFERGLIVETCGPRDEVLKIMPPLNITQHELEHGLAILEDALHATGAVLEDAPQAVAG